MKENETRIIHPRDFAEIIKAPDTGLVADFLDNPLSVITESVTGFLANGPKEWTLSVGRIVQAPFKAKLFQQVAKEIDDFRKKGKIADDFAEQRYGAKTWVELFTTIDEEAPDEDRLDALKAMFFAVNKINIDDADQILQYQLFQITKKLTSNELVVLKSVYETEDPSLTPTTGNYEQWIGSVAQSIGHSVADLVDLADMPLVENKLFKAINRQGGAVVTPRLTNLGRRLCDNIKWYHIQKNRIAHGIE